MNQGPKYCGRPSARGFVPVPISTLLLESIAYFLGKLSSTPSLGRALMVVWINPRRAGV
jgi:hypothetical protein